MTIFRTYFTKNNIISSNNYSNFAKNPVAEIAYNSSGHGVTTRFLFDIDIDGIISKLNELDLGSNIQVKHVLHLTNTIKYSGMIDKYSYSKNIVRANSFDLDLVNIEEEWDEGNGYTFTFTNNEEISSASNWKNRKTGVVWSNDGMYVSGSTEIIDTQHFDNGNENIEIDITNYVNDRITGSTSHGLCLKYSDFYENSFTNRYEIISVAFHTKYTNTVYEPYVETIIEDTIKDDRTKFYRDRDNKLYFNINLRPTDNFNLTSVKIVDYNNNIYASIPENQIYKVSNNIYYVNVNVDSLYIPDSVICYDVWCGNLNGRAFERSTEFYIVPESEELFHETKNINSFDIKLTGIGHNQIINGSRKLNIGMLVRNIYNYDVDLEAKYRVFINVGEQYQVDIIPLTDFNLMNGKYYTILDTSWLLPQTYYLEYRIISNDGQELIKNIKFIIPSNKIL